jgi:hypothetical protein
MNRIERIDITGVRFPQRFGVNCLFCDNCRITLTGSLYCVGSDAISVFVPCRYERSPLGQCRPEGRRFDFSKNLIVYRAS